jgi:hypothetical protein
MDKKNQIETIRTPNLFFDVKYKLIILYDFNARSSIYSRLKPQCYEKKLTPIVQFYYDFFIY